MRHRNNRRDVGIKKNREISVEWGREEEMS
jgi:hypothetical protein